MTPPAPPTTLRCRAVTHLAALVVLALLLAACNGAADDVAAPDATAPTATAPTATDGVEPADGFPVTIAHAFGEAEIPAAPERVVTVGFTDHDAVLALGVTPVAVRDWYGDQPFATWPWAQDELGDAEPVVLPAGELDFEQITTLEPDLIVGIGAGLTEDDYATLSRIAPTVARPADVVDYGTAWQTHTRIVGQALGHAEEADALVTEVEGVIADARAANPELDGAEGAVAVPAPDGTFWVYGPQDVRGRFLADLGVVLPADLADLAGEAFFGTLSAEQVALLDLDVLLWTPFTADDAGRLDDDPLYQGLAVASEGRDVVVPSDDPVAAAISFSSVLSLPYAVEELVPRLAAAVDGDPATEAAGR